VTRIRLHPAAVLLAAAALLVAPRPGRAQQAAPLTKSDVVRLLVDPAYSPSDVTDLVRNRCLSFQPTEGDLEDFRRLGAGPDLMEAIRSCAPRSQEETTGGQGRAPSGAPLRLELSRERLVARAGEMVVFAARVDREGIPVPDVAVVVRGSGDLPGGAGSDVAAVTDSGGTALFRLPVGRRPGRYRLRVEGGERTLAGEDSLALDVLPGAPTQAVVRPRSLEIGAGAPDTATVRVTVSDSFGNLVPYASVALLLSPAGGPERRWTSTADTTGTAAVDVAVAPLRDGDTLGVLVDGQRLAGVSVRLPPGARTASAAPSDSLAALTERAGQLLTAGSAGQALALYERILAVRPEDPDALEGQGRSLLAMGRPGEASDAFRAALAAAPGRTDLLMALGRASEAAGRPAAAREAYERVLAAEPGRADARAALRRVGQRSPPTRPYAEAAVWEGYTVLHRGGARDDWAPRRAELHVWPSRQVELWGRYDDALNLDHPGLVRGEVDVRSFWGGAGVTYGRTDRFRTRAEFGRRKLPPAFVVQTMWWLEQTVYLGDEPGDTFLRPSVHASGLLGHWYDMDDWLVEGGAGIPVSRYVRLEPRVSYGKLVGSVPSSERVQAKDARFGLGAWFRPAPGWRIEPTLTVGHVTGPGGSSDPLSGGLFDATLRLHIPAVREAGVDLFGRFQSPPGRASFAEVGMALWGAVPRR